jgi:hypothetical protein
VEKCDLAIIYYIQGLILYLLTTYCSHKLFMWMTSLSNVGFWWKQSHFRSKINLGNGTNRFFKVEKCKYLHPIETLLCNLLTRNFVKIVKTCNSSITKEDNLLVLFVCHVQISQSMVPSRPLPPPMTPTSFFGILKKPLKKTCALKWFCNV